MMFWYGLIRLWRLFYLFCNYISLKLHAQLHQNCLCDQYSENAHRGEHPFDFIQMEIVTKYVAVVTIVASCGSCRTLRTSMPVYIPLSVSSSVAMATNSTVSKRRETDDHHFKDSHPEKRKLYSCHGSKKIFSFLFKCMGTGGMFYMRSPKDNIVMLSGAIAHCNQHTYRQHIN